MIIKKEKWNWRRMTDLHNHPWRDNWYRERSLQSETARWDRKTGREYRRRRWRGTSPVARSIPPRESPSLDHTAPSPPTPTEACTPSAARSVVPDPRETASFRLAPTSEIAPSLRSIRFLRVAAVGATGTVSTATRGMPRIGLGFGSDARTGVKRSVLKLAWFDLVSQSFIHFHGWCVCLFFVSSSPRLGVSQSDRDIKKKNKTFIFLKKWKIII